MQKVKLLVGLILAGAFAGEVALAADSNYGRGNICIPLVQAQILQIEDNVELTSQVVDMMNEAVVTADDPEIISNTRPAFIWANEAKIACGKALGYLQTDHRDEQYINKCECFYERMQTYLR
ncbi:MAG: hypothetical protein ACR2O3_15165 [Rhizobiaceae bacterium]